MKNGIKTQLGEHPDFVPVNTGRASENISGQLKQAILSGRYGVGDKLPSERELSEAFGASRVVVREAVRKLELTGFVKIRQGPRGGAYVCRPGVDRVAESVSDLFLAGGVSVAELMEVRLHIQPEVARLAACAVGPENAEMLKRALAREEESHKGNKDRIVARMSIDHALLKMCGNRLYRAILTPILDLTAGLVMEVKPESEIIHDPSEHAAIVEAVLAGRGDEAAASMRAHLVGIKERLVTLEEAYRLSKGLAATQG